MSREWGGGGRGFKSFKWLSFRVYSLGPCHFLYCVPRLFFIIPSRERILIFTFVKNELPRHCFVKVLYLGFLKWPGFCTSLGNIRMLFLGFAIQVSTYTTQDLTRNDCEKCSTRSSGRNWAYGPAIPVQRPNQLSHRRQPLSCNHVLHFRSRSWLGLGVKMCSLGLQTLETAF